ncbi:lysine--tRNA ligase [Thiorhodospira sibirica]|uniref:lysine--tRNA ligase n=1 Tax=Thiorhodospira sibirica TaxID=154347 RepID=UPI00022C4C81|nr:lysine--tRNA ligase [Thiorhodospira sibirica]
MTQTETAASPDENKLIALRREKLQQLRAQGPAFPNDFRRDALAAEVLRDYAEQPAEYFDETRIEVCMAGRMMAKRVMGKASFAQLLDMSGRIQVFIERDTLAEGVYAAFKSWDIGDIVGVQGVLFKTKTGELSVRVATLRLLSKSLRPLPEKFHGLHDLETRYRQRYVDLIMNESVRETFRLRTRVIQFLRDYLNAQHFLEVETPMMQPIPGGAAARPFMTHHNALDMPLYLRIAPELYLKRLVVGGLERVYEINRNFRNEGLSTRHNPEFTMLEFYQAYADYADLMDLTEQMLQALSLEVLGRTAFSYQGQTIDLGQPFVRMSVLEAVCHYNPALQASDLEHRATAAAHAKALGIEVAPEWGVGRIWLELFETTVESKLLAPTFITGYPTEVSPLARRSDHNPLLTDRFELFIGGREIANGFSELNDPEDQAERFQAQVNARQAGDAEAMHFDADYIRALEYAMPPTAGEGIGIDRLVMLLTNAPSIRDVLLFPHLRPET